LTPRLTKTLYSIDTKIADDRSRSLGMLMSILS